MRRQQSQSDEDLYYQSESSEFDSDSEEFDNEESDSEESVVSKLARQYDKIQMERSEFYEKMALLKVQKHKKNGGVYDAIIVIICRPSTSVIPYISKMFKNYVFVEQGRTVQQDQDLVFNIIKKITSLTKLRKNSNQSFGYFLKGFPINAKQAQLFDLKTNGVILAIHLKTGEESADYIASIQPLLSYYGDRGTLLELSHSTEADLVEIEKALQEVRIKIQRSV